MKAFVIAAVAAVSVAGAAEAATSGLSDLQFLKAARCRGLASSENLGKLDTASLDALLRNESAQRDLPVQTSANGRMTSARKEADAAAGDKKAKLIAERDEVCAPFMNGAK
jgi:hypothetical protein